MTEPPWLTCPMSQKVTNISCNSPAKLRGLPYLRKPKAIASCQVLLSIFRPPRKDAGHRRGLILTISNIAGDTTDLAPLSGF